MFVMLAESDFGNGSKEEKGQAEPCMLLISWQNGHDWPHEPLQIE